MRSFDYLSSLQDANTLEATQTMLEWRALDHFPLGDQEVTVRHFRKTAAEWVDEYQRDRPGAPSGTPAGSKAGRTASAPIGRLTRPSDTFAVAPLSQPRRAQRSTIAPANRCCRVALLVCAAVLVAPATGWPQALPSVVAAPARRAVVFEEVPVTGTVVSPQSSQLSAEVEGRVTEVRVEVGDRVEAGALLAQLDPELARIEVRRAVAAAREAREALGDARRRLEEAERLAAANAFAESALLSLRSEVQVHEATEARLAAEQARASALLERHSVHAPFAGAITSKLANAGEWVSPGTPLVELVATDGLRIDFQVPQEFFRRVSVDGRVDVVLDAAPNEKLPGRVTATVPRSNAGARTFLMLVVLDDRGVPIIPGMSAHALLRLGSGRKSVVVPREALLRQPDGRASVFVVEPDPEAEGGNARVAERRVVTGRSFDGRVEIRQGLEDGTLVVVTGNEGLQDGQRVHLQREPTDV